MKLIVGLGNPGKKYEQTHHNAGFLFVDYVAKLLNCQTVKAKKNYEAIQQCNNVAISFIKPLTFMNESGRAVAEILKNSPYSVADLIVVHDDLDLRLGEFKIQKGKGPKVHNGVNDIEQKLGTKEFTRVRIGVDNREKENRLPGEAYVLQAFTEEELVILNVVFEKAYLSLRGSA